MTPQARRSYMQFSSFASVFSIIYRWRLKTFSWHSAIVFPRANKFRHYLLALYVTIVSGRLSLRQGRTSSSSLTLHHLDFNIPKYRIHWNFYPSNPVVGRRQNFKLARSNNRECMPDSNSSLRLLVLSVDSSNCRH